MLTSKVLVGLTLLLVAAVPSAQAQTVGESPEVAAAPGLRVDTMVFCAGVGNMVPVAVADTFPSDIYSVYCFTRIVGAGDTTAVVHRWYHGGKDLADIELPVKSPLWRTWSSKRMASGLRGEWKVDVTRLDGTVIRSGTFYLE